MRTYKYKKGYIHDHFTTGKLEVQIFDGKGLFYTKQVKSFHAAKIFITKFTKGMK